MKPINYSDNDIIDTHKRGQKKSKLIENPFPKGSIISIARQFGIPLYMGLESFIYKVKWNFIKKNNWKRYYKIERIYDTDINITETVDNPKLDIWNGTTRITRLDFAEHPFVYEETMQTKENSLVWGNR